MRRIGVLMGTVETAPDAAGLRAVLDRLGKLGWTEGVNARIEIRWSKSDPGLMRENGQALLALNRPSQDLEKNIGICPPSPPTLSSRAGALF
jgi:hypothetical protein